MCLLTAHQYCEQSCITPSSDAAQWAGCCSSTGVLSTDLLCFHELPGHNILSVYSPVAGEAFDKAARLLGLELRPNGGAALERLAQEGDPQRFQFSMPLKKYRDCNFSYAGTKTAVRLAVEEQLPGGPCDGNRQARCPPLLSMLDHRTRLVASGQARLPLPSARRSRDAAVANPQRMRGKLTGPESLRSGGSAGSSCKR